MLTSEWKESFVSLTSLRGLTSRMHNRDGETAQSLMSRLTTKRVRSAFRSLQPVSVFNMKTHSRLPFAAVNIIMLPIDSMFYSAQDPRT